MFGFLSKLFARRPSDDSPHEAGTRTPLPERESVRRWDAAQTHRLNEAHWAHARDGRHINDDLASHLRVLQARATYEASANPWVDGVIRTHSIDLVTPSGPTLVVSTKNAEYKRRFREAWDAWWASPEIAGELSGVDLLRRWNHTDWTKGTILGQFVSDPSVTSEHLVKLRIRDIDPRRLDTPPSLHGRADVLFGVQRDRGTGRATKFYVRRYDGRTAEASTAWKFDDFTADDAIFAFHSVEPDQAIGFPRLSSCLDEISQLRDFDTEVLDAARQFANNAMVMHTEVPELVLKHGKKLPTSSPELRRGTMNYSVPGWKPTSLQSSQPAVNYVPFRHEKLRGLGRSAHMPLLLILLSAEQSNFSQSKLDVNVFYERGLSTDRHWLESSILEPIRRRFSLELQLVQVRGKFYLPSRPDDLRFSWHWERMPQADELKHLQAKKLKRQLAMTTWSIDVAEEGIDRDRLQGDIESDKQALEALGIDPLGGEVLEPASPANEDESPSGPTQPTTEGAT